MEMKSGQKAVMNEKGRSGVGLIQRARIGIRRAAAMRSVLKSPKVRKVKTISEKKMRRDVELIGQEYLKDETLALCVERDCS